MNVIIYLLPLLAIILLSMPLIPVYRGVTTGVKAKRAVIFNIAAFFGVCLIAILLPFGGLLSAAETANAAAAAGSSAGLGYLAAALVTSVSCIGAGIAVAAAAPAAIGAFSEDPKAFGKALIFVALGEGIALYGLLISILILNKI
ncbi:ATP synthase subunit C [Acetanaerobacterium elongatum]|uniref:ATP synthase F(0) sector subunit c n=1 Tax=Acetanaerobacterium elongatum TaxID=258515 RepID=A0A1G9ZVL2_9FIRM|nr:ATP synthase subunit C [Acetanaerobacterium elongatum]SDN25489.1 V/A-type H+-transporting ATPase subunit K [Acetanaerobacterium elongatum]